MCHVVSPMVVRDSSMSIYAVDSPSSFFAKTALVFSTPDSDRRALLWNSMEVFRWLSNAPARSFSANALPFCAIFFMRTSAFSVSPGDSMLM